MFFDSWVLDWFAILNLATIGLALVVWMIDRARNAR